MEEQNQLGHMKEKQYVANSPSEAPLYFLRLSLHKVGSEPNCLQIPAPTKDGMLCPPSRPGFSPV